MRQTGANKDRRHWGNDKRINISHPDFDVTKHRSLSDEERLRGNSDSGNFGKIATQAERLFSTFKQP
jgi:hypothetical protein